MRKYTLAQAHIVFLFAAFFISGVWTHLYSLGFPIYCAVAAVTAALCLPFPGAFSRPVAFERLGRPSGKSILIGIAIALPAFVFLGVTFHEEFPFMGDTDWHLLGAIDALRVWRYQLLLAPLAVWGYLAASKRWPFRYWPVVAMAALVVVSAAVNWKVALRYPSGFYFFCLPFTFAQRVLHGDYPVNACRIANTLTVPAWLFVLRPLFLRRWPDLAVLPFAFLFYFQKDVIHYLGSAYPETCAVAFLLVAVEAVVTDDPNRDWLPSLLVGLAAIVKEQSILALPWIALAGIWSGFPSIKRGKELLLTGVTAAVPFLLYYRVRATSDVFRKFSLLPWEKIVDADRARLFLHTQYHYLGASGIAAAAVLLALGFRARPAALLLIGAAVTQFLFFYVDAYSAPYTGYFRFNLMLAALLGGLVISLGRRLQSSGRTAALVSCAALAAVGQLIPLLQVGALTLQPDSARSYLEYYDGIPMHFPIRSLLSRANPDVGKVRVVPLLKDMASTEIREDDYFKWHLRRSIPLGYPSLSKRYAFDIVPLTAIAACECRAGGEAVMILATYASPPAGSPPQTDLFRKSLAQCVAAAERTCARTLRETVNDGALVGLLAWHLL